MERQLLLTKSTSDRVERQLTPWRIQNVMDPNLQSSQVDPVTLV
jgi:hypothetical protein